jgi:hypothetical protein
MQNSKPKHIGINTCNKAELKPFTEDLRGQGKGNVASI